MTDVNQTTNQTVPEAETNEPSPDTGTQGNATKTNDKKRRKRSTYDIRMAAIRQGLTNAEKPGLFHDLIGEYGYTDARIAEGRQLFNQTEQARSEQLKAIAAKDQKFREGTQLREEIDEQYTHFLVIGREEFKDNPHILALLGLKGQRKRTINAWREQVNQLYDNTGETGVPEGFANHNITPEDLNAQKQKLTDWDNLIADVKTAKSEAENATESKNKVYKKLLAWWKKFSIMVDLAVEEYPQLKEQISIVTPTTQ